MATPRSRRGRGQKRSSALTVQRRLWLISRFVRGPATPAELIADARRTFDSSIYPPNALVALRHDFNALRNEFLCTIERQPDGRYALTDFGRLTLLNLPDEELEALAFLIAMFSEGNWPNGPQVQSLLDHVIALLPHERRSNLRQQQEMEVELPHSSQPVDQQLLARLKRNLRRHALRFLYRSTFSQEPEAHRVAPVRLLLRDGHTYLEAYCYKSPHQATVGRYIPYRVDRIIPDSLRRTAGLATRTAAAQDVVVALPALAASGAQPRRSALVSQQYRDVSPRRQRRDLGPNQRSVASRADSAPLPRTLPRARTG